MCVSTTWPSWLTLSLHTSSRSFGTMHKSCLYPRCSKTITRWHGLYERAKSSEFYYSRYNYPWPPVTWASSISGPDVSHYSCAIVWLTSIGEPPSRRSQWLLLFSVVSPVSNTLDMRIISHRVPPSTLPRDVLNPAGDFGPARPRQEGRPVYEHFRSVRGALIGWWWLCCTLFSNGITYRQSLLKLALMDKYIP
jgi:hypothetical protein